MLFSRRVDTFVPSGSDNVVFIRLSRRFFALEYAIIRLLNPLFSANVVLKSRRSFDFSILTER